ncbi:hypothetical protein Intca_2905 [Intrasporangium calvum DSM 43043]|uniref:Lipoprotein n=2 Tax=Intrasporangium calvum TaxID=53358 RepID=E6SAT9_INTC7|nr:hypothetical protein Intca_2905 [Intrasporangium calvum DSM 43043]
MRLVSRGGASAALIACTGVGALLLSACGSASTLRMAGDAPAAFGQTILAPEGETKLSVGVITLCVSEGSARVTAARFTSGNLPIAHYGVWSSAGSTVGYLPGDLVTHGFPSEPDPVDVVCGPVEEESDVGEVAALAIDIEATDEVREGKGLTLTYETADGEQGELEIPFELKVCPPTQPAPCQEPSG